jgi:hypothetical protein
MSLGLERFYSSVRRARVKQQTRMNKPYPL